MNIEILKNVLSAETFAKVAEETSKVEGKLADLSSNAYVDKHKYTALEEQLNTTNDLLATRDNELAELKKNAGNSEELQNQIEALKTQHETENAELKKEYEGKIKKATVANHIMSKFSPNDINDIMPHIDLEKAVFDGETLKDGIDSQVEELKKSKPYYFESASKRTGFEHGGQEPDDDPFIKGFKS